MLSLDDLLPIEPRLDVVGDTDRAFDLFVLSLEFLCLLSLDDLLPIEPRLDVVGDTDRAFDLFSLPSFFCDPGAGDLDLSFVALSLEFLCLLSLSFGTA